LMEMVERGEVEQLLTFSFSRIARSTSHSHRRDRC
jgi:hypothetical protein